VAGMTMVLYKVIPQQVRDDNKRIKPGVTNRA